MPDPSIRAETPNDHDPIRELTAAAFGREQEARIVDAIRDSENFVPELSLVAELDGRVVGHVMLSYVGLDGDARRVLALGPLSVAPEHQSEGVGGALTREALYGEPMTVASRSCSSSATRLTTPASASAPGTSSALGGPTKTHPQRPSWRFRCERTTRR